MNLLDPSERVLVTGATGWFGKSGIAIANDSGCTVLGVSSRSTVFELAGISVNTSPLSLSLITDFAPTVVIDSAFLTREKLYVVGFNEYVDINRELIESSVQIASLPSVRKYVGFSSGATVHLAGKNSFSLEDNPYAALKIEYEKEMSRLNSSSDKEISIARVWSVSGVFFTKPEVFAFTNLISQASSGRIEIKSAGMVYRRYCSIDMVIGLALAQGKQLSNPIFDTGGELIEIGDLAKIVRDEINPGAQIIRELSDQAPDDNYFSDGSQWDNLLKTHGLSMETIRSQVKHVKSRFSF